MKHMRLLSHRFPVLPGIQETTSVGKLAINNAGEYFQDSQSLMKHKQNRLSLTTKRSSQLVSRRRRLTKTTDDRLERRQSQRRLARPAKTDDSRPISSYTATHNGMTQLHGDFRNHAHEATLPYG